MKTHSLITTLLLFSIFGCSSGTKFVPLAMSDSPNFVALTEDSEIDMGDRMPSLATQHYHSTGKPNQWIITIVRSDVTFQFHIQFVKESPVQGRSYSVQQDSKETTDAAPYRVTWLDPERPNGISYEVSGSFKIVQLGKKQGDFEIVTFDLLLNGKKFAGSAGAHVLSDSVPYKD